MKGLKFYSIFAIVFVMMFVSGLFFASNNIYLMAEDDANVVFNEDDDTNNDDDDNNEEILVLTEIDDLSDISAYDGKYILTKDCIFTELQLSSFSGILDGGGHTITIVSDEDEEPQKAFSPLFKKLENATVRNLCVEGLVLDFSQDDAYSGEFVGIIAGDASNTNFSNIKINNCTIENVKINSSYSVGFLVGRARNNSVIRNCFVQNCKLNLGIEEAVSDSFYYGGLVGEAENIQIFNNIVDLEMYNISQTEVTKSITISSQISKEVYFGGIIGILNSNNNYLYNNVSCFSYGNSETNFSVDQLTTLKVGSMIGYMAYEQLSSQIHGFLSTYDQYFGKRAANSVEYIKLNSTSYAQITSAYFSDSTKWNNVKGFAWEFDKTWHIVPNSKLPLLQTYSKYTATFSTVESDKSLNVETLPLNSIVFGDIKTNQSELENIDEVTTLEDISYGSSIYISAKITTEYQYNKFFRVLGLKLNDKLIYDNLAGENGEPVGDNNITLEYEDGVYTYRLDNFVASMAGTYYISIDTIGYELDIVVYNLGTENKPNLPGGFKSNTNSNVLTSNKISMVYGDKIILTSIANNKDYSDITKWYIHDGNGENVFDISNASENFKSNKIEWSFTENCELFLNEDNVDILRQFYDLSKFEKEDKPDYKLYILFEKSVKEIEIELKFQNGEKLEKQVAKISVDGKVDRVVWNDEKKCYVAKINYTADTFHNVRLEGVEIGYTFVAWRYGLGDLPDLDEDPYVGVFEIAASLEEDTDTDVMKLFCVFEDEVKDNGMKLLWLWITLGALGLVSVVTIIIVIIRRRGGGGKPKKETRRYYY